MTLRRVIFGGLLVLAAGCGATPQGVHPESPPPPPGLLTFGPGDEFSVFVYGEDDLSGVYTVGADGTINYPLIGRVEVRGMTAAGLEKQLEESLEGGYLVNPQVSVRSSQFRSKRVTVLGAVNSPGTFSYEEGLSIVEAIVKAGGFEPRAKRDSVRVTRQMEGEGKRVVVAVEAIGKGQAPPFFVHPGDVIYVPERVLF